MAYHVGPGPAEVHFETWMDYQVRPIWNVIATLPGTVEPDRWVLVGNHRDAWVYGAVDPSSGTAATLEMCRALGSAVKHGWKPRRTLVYASWDAEEYGLVGSTEWVEDHARELDEKSVLLLNVDSAVAGPELDIDGVPSLRDWFLDAAAAVHRRPYGQDRSTRSGWPSSVSVGRARTRLTCPTCSAPIRTRNPNRPGLGRGRGRPPGSCPRCVRSGRARITRRSLTTSACRRSTLGFSGRYGVYHSVYDNFTWMEKVGDPEFITHANAARLLHSARHARRRRRGGASNLHAVRRGAAGPHRRSPPDGRTSGPSARVRDRCRAWQRRPDDRSRRRGTTHVRGPRLSWSGPSAPSTHRRPRSTVPPRSSVSGTTFPPTGSPGSMTRCEDRTRLCSSPTDSPDVPGSSTVSMPPAPRPDTRRGPCQRSARPSRTRNASLLAAQTILTPPGSTPLPRP